MAFAQLYKMTEEISIRKFKTEMPFEIFLWNLTRYFQKFSHKLNY